MRGKTETIHAFTERAIRATEAGTLIPPIVYLPRSLRRQKMMLTTDCLGLTVDPPTVEENHVKIAAADPVGFLIAIMHGQPIPAFRITGSGGVEMQYEVPAIEQRIRVAEYLGHKATIRASTRGQRQQQGSKDHDSMIARAAEAINKENENGVEETP